MAADDPICLTREEAVAFVRSLSEPPANPKLAAIYWEHLGTMKPSARLERCKNIARERNGQDGEQYAVVMTDLIMYLDEEHERSQRPA